MASTSNEKGAITLATLEKMSLTTEERADIELRRISQNIVLRQQWNRPPGALGSMGEIIFLKGHRDSETGVSIKCRTDEAVEYQHKYLALLARRQRLAGGKDQTSRRSVSKGKRFIERRSVEHGNETSQVPSSTGQQQQQQRRRQQRSASSSSSFAASVFSGPPSPRDSFDISPVFASMHEEVARLNLANKRVVVESPANTTNNTNPKPFAMSGDAPATAMAEANEDEPDVLAMGERVGNDQEEVSEWHNTLAVLFFAETLSSHLPRGEGIASGEDSLPPWDGGDVLGSEMPGIADHLAGTFKTTPDDPFGFAEELAASPMEDGVQTAAATPMSPLSVAVATAIGGDHVAVATAVSDQDDDEGGYAATRLDWEASGVIRDTNVGQQLHRAGRVESNLF